MAEDWVEITYDLLREQLRDSQNVDRLTALGCPPETIDRLLSFFPLWHAVVCCSTGLVCSIQQITV
jgi:hypothetical protein